MKKYLYMAVAAIAALSSCSGDNDILSDVETPKSEAKVFTATIENDVQTRTTLNNKNRANWESTDEVMINDILYSVEPDAKYATVAVLTKKSEEDADPTGTYKAYYPASSMRENRYSKKQAVIPAVQTYVEGKLSNIPMYAEGETTELAFKNICGVLAISGITETDLKAIRVISSKENDMLSGTFTVDASKDYAIKMSIPSSNQTTLSMGSGVDANGKTFYIAVPPASYGQLQIVVESGDSKIKHMTTKSAVTIQRNKIYPIAFDASIHNGQETVLPIVAIGDYSSTDVTTDCVVLWPGGPIFAQTNITATIRNSKDITSSSVNDQVGYNLYWGETTSYGSVSQSTTKLTGKDDTCTNYWGVLWRMPSKSEYEELLSKCTNAYYYVNNKQGRIVKMTGKDDFSTSVLYLPFAGNNDHNTPTRVLGYWTSDVDEQGCYYLVFKTINSSFAVDYRDHTNHAFSVRAVLQ